MNRNSPMVLQAAAVVFAGAFAWTAAHAQDSLQAQLVAKYKLVKLGSDSSGLQVIEPGTVLALKKGGIVSVPSGDTIVLPTMVKDGEVHGASGAATEGAKKLLGMKFGVQKDTKLLPVGEKIYVSRIDVDKKGNKVGLSIIECDTCNGVQDPSSRKALVVFQFPQGYLDGADGGQVADVISQIMDVDNSGNQQQQGQDQGQQAQDQQQQQPAAQEPPPPPAQIQLGQSIDDVTAALGQPEKIVNLGPKQIYVYKDLKITFVKGKVSDVQ